MSSPEQSPQPTETELDPGSPTETEQNLQPDKAGFQIASIEELTKPFKNSEEGWQEIASSKGGDVLRKESEGREWVYKKEDGEKDSVSKNQTIGGRHQQIVDDLYDKYSSVSETQKEEGDFIIFTKEIYFADAKGNISYKIFERSVKKEKAEVAPDNLFDSDDYDDLDDVNLNKNSVTTLNLNSLFNSKHEQASKTETVSSWQNFWDNLLKPKAEPEKTPELVNAPLMGTIRGFPDGAHQLTAALELTIIDEQNTQAETTPLFAAEPVAEESVDIAKPVAESIIEEEDAPYFVSNVEASGITLTPQPPSLPPDAKPSQEAKTDYSLDSLKPEIAQDSVVNQANALTESINDISISIIEEAAEVEELATTDIFEQIQITPVITKLVTHQAIPRALSRATEPAGRQAAASEGELRDPSIRVPVVGMAPKLELPSSKNEIPQKAEPAIKETKALLKEPVKAAIVKPEPVHQEIKEAANIIVQPQVKKEAPPKPSPKATQSPSIIRQPIRIIKADKITSRPEPEVLRPAIMETPTKSVPDKAPQAIRIQAQNSKAPKPEPVATRAQRINARPAITIRSKERTTTFQSTEAISLFKSKPAVAKARQYLADDSTIESQPQAIKIAA